MNKALLLVYANNLGTREEVKGVIDDMPEIKIWRFDMPNSFYLISPETPSALSKKLREKLPNGRFLISEISENVQGFLPKQSWHLIQNKSLMPL